MLRIAVLMKQVPDLREKLVFKTDGTLDRTCTGLICNPCDMKALELALSLKDKVRGSFVTAVSMGPQSASEILLDAMYRGADRAFLLSDRLFAGADTLATSRVLAAALKRISADVVFCGNYTIDGGTSQVGPEVAEMLGIPDVRSAISVKRTTGGLSVAVEGHGTVILKGPVLISVSDGGLECRPCNLRNYIRHPEVTTLTAKDLGLSESEIGSAGSKTYVKNVIPVTRKKQDRVVSDNVEIVFQEGIL